MFTHLQNLQNRVLLKVFERFKIIRIERILKNNKINNEQNDPSFGMNRMNSYSSILPEEINANAIMGAHDLDA